jgi:hypothetical protein
LQSLGSGRCAPSWFLHSRTGDVIQRRPHVIDQPLEHRLAQDTVLGNPAKADLGEGNRLEPSGFGLLAVDISSVIRASNDSFRVAWIERRYENASLAATERWTAILTIVLDSPHDAERLRRNPLGVFVHAINWSKELG